MFEKSTFSSVSFHLPFLSREIRSRGGSHETKVRNKKYAGYSTKTASRDVENIPTTGLRALRGKRRDEKREREKERAKAKISLLSFSLALVPSRSFIALENTLYTSVV